MLVLPATLTAREAADTLRLLRQTLQAEGGGEPVVVDAGRLQQFDSASLAVLLELDRLASAWGRRFEVRNAPAKLASLGRLYGVDQLLWKNGAKSAANDNGKAPVEAGTDRPQRSPAA